MNTSASERDFVLLHKWLTWPPARVLKRFAYQHRHPVTLRACVWELPRTRGLDQTAG